MIYTITFNPAVDLVFQLDRLNLGELNRVKRENFVAGGKGINISVLLKRLDKDSIATGFIGGFTGQFIIDDLKEEGIESAFIQVEGNTRVNCKIHSECETEINGNGPIISEEKFNDFINYFERELKKDDVVFLAGNAAPGMRADSYTSIAKLCLVKGAKFILDSNLQNLTSCLEYRPFIIKPNHHELGEIFDIELNTIDQIVYYAKKLQEKGARNVLVSRGKDGAILITEDKKVYQSNVPKGKVVNSVGAGDSMLAGFMAKYIDEENYVDSLLQGAAAGSATAFSTGICQLSLIEKLKEDILVKELT